MKKEKIHRDLHSYDGKLFFKGDVEIKGMLFGVEELYAYGNVVIFGDINNSVVKSEKHISIYGKVFGNNSLVYAKHNIKVYGASSSNLKAEGKIFIEGKTEKSNIEGIRGIEYKIGYGFSYKDNLISSMYIVLNNVEKSRIEINSRLQENIYKEIAKVENEIERLQRKMLAVEGKIRISKRLRGSDGNYREYYVLKERINQLFQRKSEFFSEVLSEKDKLHKIFVYGTAKKGTIFRILGKDIKLYDKANSFVIFLDNGITVKEI